MLQAADLVQARKTIPDYATWSQCFTLYVAVLIVHQPGRLANLMDYQSLIARVSKKYKWPSWVMYDRTSGRRWQASQTSSGPSGAQSVHSVAKWSPVCTLSGQVESSLYTQWPSGAQSVHLVTKWSPVCTLSDQVEPSLYTQWPSGVQSVHSVAKWSPVCTLSDQVEPSLYTQ